MAAWMRSPLALLVGQNRSGPVPGYLIHAIKKALCEAIDQGAKESAC